MKIRLQKVGLNQKLKVCIIILRVIGFYQQVIPSHLISNIQGSCNCAVNVYVEINFVIVCWLFEWKFWVRVIFICFISVFVLEIQVSRRENRIGSVIVNVLASSVVDRVF